MSDELYTSDTIAPHGRVPSFFTLTVCRLCGAYVGDEDLHRGSHSGSEIKRLSALSSAASGDRDG